MNKLTKIAGIVALTVSMASHGATNYAELNKELEIMNSVLATTLKQTSKEEAIRFRGLETSYLASQGVVFQVSTSRGSWGVHHDLRSFIPETPVAPSAPLIIGGDGRSIQIEIHDEWEHMIEDTVRQVESLFRESNEQLRDVRGDARELSWEMREYERRMRDLNFELRNTNQERKTEIEQDLQELKAEIAAVKARQQELEEYASTLEAEQKAQMDQQKAAYKKSNKAFLSAFEDRIADTLCRFGAGLRALPDDEHISFVLKGFHAEEKQGKQDRIYVFKETDVKMCVQEKMDAIELLGKATVYEF